MGAFIPPPGQPDPKMDPKFRSGSLPAVTTFGFEKVSPPSPLYLQRDDVLLISVFSSLATEVVTFRARMLLAPTLQGGQPSDQQEGKQTGTYLTRGYVDSIEEPVAVSGAFQSTSKARVLTEGYLLGITAVPSQATQRGMTFVKALLVRNGLTFANAALVLFADYATSTVATSWPGGRILAPIEGPGFTHMIQAATPAAGADWTFSPVTSQRLRIISLNADLAVANSGAARPVEIIVDDGANVVARMATNAAAPINATAHVNFSQSGTPSTSIPSDLYAQMPTGILIVPGSAVRIRSLTTNIVAGDAWTNIWVLVEEWLSSG